MDNNNSTTEKDFVKEKITDFAKILQNFGLQLIQSIGEMKHTLGILSEKMERVEGELINLKGLGASMQDLDKFRREVKQELSEIKAQFNSVASKMSSGSTTLSNFNPQLQENKKNSPREVLEEFGNRISLGKTALEFRNAITFAKEQLFILTGGHKVLFEIREWERKIQPKLEITETIKSQLEAKILEWKNLF